MRKIIALMTAAVSAAAFTLSVYAAETPGTADTVTGIYANGTVRTEAASDDGTYAVLSFYDNGVLTYSASAQYADSAYTFNVPEEYAEDDARLCVIGGGIYDMSIETEPESTAAPTEAPSETAAPDATAEPTAKPSESTDPRPDNTPYPAAYESELDADNAPAVVSSVSVASIDGEEYDVLTLLYTGSEITVNIRDTVTIDWAPDASSYLIGSGANALQDGDVIHFSTDLQGRVKSIELIYRPDFDNYVESGNTYGKNFEQLISASGIVAGQNGWKVASYGSTSQSGQLYAFGVPIETEHDFMTLANSDGIRMDIAVNPDAMVYTINGRSRSSKSEFSGNGGMEVTRTYIPRDDYDDELNVASWDDIEDISYALVRIIDGVATDIFVFINW